MYTRENNNYQSDAFSETEITLIALGTAIYGILGAYAGYQRGYASLACSEFLGWLSEECSKRVAGSTLIGAGVGLAVGAGASLFFTYKARLDVEAHKAREQQKALMEARYQAYINSDEFERRMPGGPAGNCFTRQGY